MTSDLARISALGREEGEEIETVPVEPRRSNCSTPSVNSTSALEDILLKLESRLSQGQSELEARLSQNLSKGKQALAQETSVALDKLTESQAQLSYQIIAQTAESAEVMHRLASLEQSVQNSRHSSLRSSPNLSAGLPFTTGNHLVQPGTSSIPLSSEEAADDAIFVPRRSLRLQGRTQLNYRNLDRMDNCPDRRTSLKELHKSDTLSFRPSDIIIESHTIENRELGTVSLNTLVSETEPEVGASDYRSKAAAPPRIKTVGLANPGEEEDQVRAARHREGTLTWPGRVGEQQKTHNICPAQSLTQLSIVLRL